MNPAGLVRQSLCAALLSAATTACVTVDAAPESVRVDMSNVDLHVTSDVTLHVTQLRGRFVPGAWLPTYPTTTTSDRHVLCLRTGNPKGKMQNAECTIERLTRVRAG